MTVHTRRYIFLDFETLKRIKFKKLEKVCDKVFIFTGTDIEAVPFPLVRDMQRMGSAVKWVEVGSASAHDLNYHICFLMGKLHEKISGDIEFAILSNDLAFDPLVNFINSTGRNCVRIKTGTDLSAAPPLSNEELLPVKKAANLAETLTLPVAENTAAKPIETTPEATPHRDDLGSRLLGERRSEVAVAVASANSEHTVIEHTASETVRRLIRTGHRPTDLANLKSYILLHNQELSAHGDIEKIIDRLAAANEIKISNGAVSYNF
jgi:hypothetical protein